VIERTPDSSQPIIARSVLQREVDPAATSSQARYVVTALALDARASAARANLVLLLQLLYPGELDPRDVPGVPRRRPSRRAGGRALVRAL